MEVRLDAEKSARIGSYPLLRELLLDGSHIDNAVGVTSVRQQSLERVCLNGVSSLSRPDLMAVLALPRLATLELYGVQLDSTSCALLQEAAKRLKRCVLPDGSLVPPTGLYGT
jgi:hypothetical protein